MYKKRLTEKRRRDLSRETQLKDDSTLSSIRRFEDKIRVMLVDDHPAMREVLRTMLSSESDIEVAIEASDGEEAVQLAREILPDVILMDINMPNMNGLEATRIIHSQFPQIRIIGLSVYHGEDLQAAAMISAGASAYRSKTDDTAVIVAAIRGEV
jgi:DNA-binding NarL/FixJ family response regulator